MRCWLSPHLDRPPSAHSGARRPVFVAPMAILSTLHQRRRREKTVRHIHRQSQHDCEWYRNPMVYHVGFRTVGVAADLPIAYGINCLAGNGMSVPYYRDFGPARFLPERSRGKTKRVKIRSPFESAKA